MLEWQLPAPIFRRGFFAAAGRGAEDRQERVCALKSCGVDGRAHVRLGLCGPHGA